MNYSAFCDTFIASLSERLDASYSLTKESIRKNNGVMLDALVLRMSDISSAPVIYLESLYEHYLNGSSMENLCHKVISGLKKDSIITPEMIQRLQDLETASDKIAFRLVSRKENAELLKDVPWLPFLDLAIIFHLHLGRHAGNQITSIIHKRQMCDWNLSPTELFRIAKDNTKNLYPSAITRLEHLIFGWDPENNPFLSCESDFPTIYVLTNQNGINGASCMLYEDTMKDFADRIGSDFIILPSSVHEVLLIPDSGSLDYHMLRNMVRTVNINDVPKEDVLSDEIYIYHRNECPSVTRWHPSEPDVHESDGK